MLRQTLWSYFETTYQPLVLRGGSDLTSIQYRIQIDHFSRWLAGENKIKGYEATLEDLNDENVSKFLAQRAKDTSPANANKCRNHILPLWRLACRKGLIQIWPDVPKLSTPRRIPQAWTVRQIDALFGACKSLRGKIDGLPAARLMTCFHWLLWNTAERKGATVAIEFMDLDLDERTLHIPAEKRKGQKSDAFYQLWPETVNAIRLIQSPSRQYLFPELFRTNKLYYHYRKLLASANLPVGRFSGPHRMRRSFASHLEAAGGDASKALGHSSRKITEDSYIDPRIAKKFDPSSLLWRPGRNGDEPPSCAPVGM